MRLDTVLSSQDQSGLLVVAVIVCLTRLRDPSASDL